MCSLLFIMCVTIIPLMRCAYFIVHAVSNNLKTGRPPTILLLLFDRVIRINIINYYFRVLEAGSLIFTSPTTSTQVLPLGVRIKMNETKLFYCGISCHSNQKATIALRVPNQFFYLIVAFCFSFHSPKRHRTFPSSKWY